MGNGREPGIPNPSEMAYGGVPDQPDYVTGTKWGDKLMGRFQGAQMAMDQFGGPPQYDPYQWNEFSQFSGYQGPGGFQGPQGQGAAEQGQYVNALKQALGIQDPVDTRQSQMAALDQSGSRALNAIGSNVFERGVRGSLGAAPGTDYVSQAYLPAAAQIEQGYAQQQAQAGARDMGMAQNYAQMAQQLAQMQNQYNLSASGMQNQFAQNQDAQRMQANAMAQQAGMDENRQAFDINQWSPFEMAMLLASNSMG